MRKKWIFLIAVLAIVIIVGIFCAVLFSKKKQKDRDYELLIVSEYLYYPLEVNGKYGVIKRDGTIIIEPEYDMVQIPNSDKAIFVAKNSDGYKALNETGGELYTNYQEVSAIEGVSEIGNKIYNNTVLKYKENGKYGIIDFDGNKVTDAIYEEMTSLEDKYGEILVKKDGKYGVINIKGVSLVECKYDYVKGDGFVKDASYKFGGYIVGNRARAGFSYGYLDNRAKEVISLSQENIYRVTEIDSEDAYLVAQENGRCAIYKGEENLTDYKYISVFYNNGTNTFTVQKNKLYGLVNLEGNAVIPEQYDELLVVGVFVKASKGGVDYTFDLNGNLIDNSEFVSLQLTSTDKFYISIDDNYKYGITDLDKNVVVENKFDYIEENPTTGLLIATVDNDVTIYSAGVKEIVSISNADLKFVGSYIQVTNSDESYFLTSDGKKVDNKTVYYENQLFASKSGSKWGFVNLKDNVIVDYKYDEVTEFNEFGFAGIKQNGKWGVINSYGTVVLEPLYVSSEVSPVFIDRYYFDNGVLRDHM